MSHHITAHLTRSRIVLFQIPRPLPRPPQGAKGPQTGGKPRVQHVRILCQNHAGAVAGAGERLGLGLGAGDDVGGGAGVRGEGVGCYGVGVWWWW